MKDALGAILNWGAGTEALLKIKKASPSNPATGFCCRAQISNLRQALKTVSIYFRDILTFKFCY